MNNQRSLALAAAFAAISLAVSVTGQNPPSQPVQPEQPRFNRPDAPATTPAATPDESRVNPADPTAPASRPGTAVETDARSAKRAAGNVELARADRNFFEKAAKASQKEITVSQTVMGKLTAPGAREFAEMMVRDHTAANEELLALAQRKGADFSDVQNSRDQERFARRWQDNNNDLDEDYLKEMVKDHEDSVELFEKASKSEDPEIAAFAQKTLPKLQHHLEMARTHHKSVEDRR